MTLIYVLKDPRNGNIRYVGKTKMTLKRRFYLHMNAALGHKFNRPICKWINELNKLSIKPLIEEILRTDGDGSNEEIQALERFINLGYRMLNSAPAGGGSTRSHLINWTPELIARLGRDTDQEIANDIIINGKPVTRKSVHYMREKLGIPCTNVRMVLRNRHVNKPPLKWIITDEIRALFGKIFDRDIAKKFGYPRNVINKARRKAGIPSPDPRMKGKVYPVKLRQGVRNEYKK